MAVTSGPAGRRGGHEQQLYFPDTAILITRFMTEGGVGEVVDFMPSAGDRPRRATGWSGWCAASAGR